MGKYRNFAELKAAEIEGTDYRITLRHRDTSSIAIIAPHGGGIEPRTAMLAKMAAGDDLNLYVFEGIKEEGNSELHIASHRFDESQCLELLWNCEIAVAVHGCKGNKSRICLGGLDQSLIDRLHAQLRLQDLPVAMESHAYPGEEPENICNRTLRGCGVQLEISLDLRTNEGIRRQIAIAVREALKTCNNSV